MPHAAREKNYKPNLHDTPTLPPKHVETGPEGLHQPAQAGTEQELDQAELEQVRKDIQNHGREV